MKSSFFFVEGSTFFLLNSLSVTSSERISSLSSREDLFLFSCSLELVPVGVGVGIMAVGVEVGVGVVTGVRFGMIEARLLMERRRINSCMDSMVLIKPLNALRRLRSIFVIS